jgi:hemoglobin
MDMAKMAKASLYDRLGGYNAIAAVIDDLMRRMLGDPRLAKYFIGLGDDSKKRLRQLQVDMICQSVGGPCFYTGRGMKTVHTGIGIGGVEWQAMITHLIGALDDLKVADEVQKEILNLLGAIKGDIVERP